MRGISFTFHLCSTGGRDARLTFAGRKQCAKCTRLPRPVSYKDSKKHHSDEWCFGILKGPYPRWRLKLPPAWTPSCTM